MDDWRNSPEVIATNQQVELTMMFMNGSATNAIKIEVDKACLNISKIMVDDGQFLFGEMRPLMVGGAREHVVAQLDCIRTNAGWVSNVLVHHFTNAVI